MLGSRSLGWLLVLFLIFVAGCGERGPLATPADVIEPGSPRASAAATPAPASSVKPAAQDDLWRGLERHEIQLDQKLLVVKGSRGVIGCGYLDIAAFERFGEVCAIVPAVDTHGMPDAKVTAVTTKAKELGIEVGMSGREALDKIR